MGLPGILRGICNSSSTPTRCLPRNITERIHVEGPLVGVLLVACTLESLSEAMRKEA